MSRDQNRDGPRYNNASAGPSRTERVGGSVSPKRRTLSSNPRSDAPHRSAATAGEQGSGGGGRASSRTTALLREFQLQEQQRRQAIESARLPVAHTMAQVVQRLGAASGVAIGPARAKLNRPVVHRAQKSAQNPQLVPMRSTFTAGVVGPNKNLTNSVVMVSKSAVSPIFPWPQDQDELQESRTRSNKRAREAGGFVDDDVPAPRRVGRIATAYQRPLRMREANEQPAKRARTPNVHIDRRLALRIDDDVVDEGPGLSPGSALGGGSDGSDMDVDEEPLPAPVPPPVLTTARKTLPRAATQIARKSGRPTAPKSPIIPSIHSPSSSPEPSYPQGRIRTVSRKVGKTMGIFKAARKTEFIPTDSENESEDKSDDDESESSSSSRQTTHELADESDEEYELDVKQEEDEDAGLRHFGPPELIRLDSPPPITIPLPQIDSETAENPFPPRLVDALSSLTPVVTPLRLHETRQLPFLIRNIRQGFLLRCKSLGIPLTKSPQGISLNVRFQHVDNIQHEVRFKKWKCPICSLHGEFPNQGVLASHLDWDHAELFVEWQRHKSNSWSVNILVSETIPEEARMGADAPQVAPLSAIPANRRATLFPPVTLSPPASPRPSTSSSVEPVSLPPGSPTPETSASPAPSLTSSTPTPFGDIKGKGKRRMYYQPTPSTTTASTRGQSATATGTSTTGRSSATASTTRMPSTAFVGPDGKRYPTPPPPDDPLGPSARRPYLPAEPIYSGGQTVYYSCRPGGETLYDLLNTLPMEPYGVLEWAVLDKEEEIFESDEVKDEYKVMHALWARWIFLNRTQFLANYYKGTVAFLDEYWKMIHRAAGWDALRYWLLLLLANRFLTAKEVANLLKRYEAHTGMDHWKE